MFDPILKSYSLPTSILIEILDENDNLPYEPFLANPFDLSIEQSNNEETMIYEFKPIDLDDGPNGIVSIECLNCSSSSYFHLIENNSTRNISVLMTRTNVTVPDGIYSLGFLLRDHGSQIVRERVYTLTFNFSHRSNFDNEDERISATTSSMIFFMKRSNFFTRFSLEKFQWQMLACLLIFWLFLVIVALWTCCHYERKAKRKRDEKRREQHERLERQVRQHEILGQTIISVQKSASFPVMLQPLPEKETLNQEEDEIEDTSYDADHIMTDANFVLTPAAAVNESNIRYVSVQ